MKKIIFAFAALAAITACNKAEVVDVTPDNLIGFDAPFVDNATKALGEKDYSGTKELTGFKVYGTVTGNAATVNLFDAVQINRGAAGFGDEWSYANTDDVEYWVPSCSYSFAAVVDGTVSDKDAYGMPTVISYSIGEGDLLYATASASTSASGTPSGVTDDGYVAFTFNHLLSKVYFTFENGFDNDDYKYKVNEVTISGFANDGTYTIGAQDPWTLGEDPTPEALSFGTLGVLDSDATVTSNTDHLVIPGEQTVTISFTYDVIFKDEKISSFPVTHVLENQEFAQKTVYNINVTLPALGNEIKFTVTGKPDDFSTDGSINI